VRRLVIIFRHAVAPLLGLPVSRDKGR
jgi:hypothetical protein